MNMKRKKGKTMDDLISRAQAIDTIEDFPHGDVWNVESMEEMIDRIKLLPSAQPKMGRWIHHPEIGWGETWLCDQCGEKTTSTVMGKPRANFCPNCGADMREVTT